MKAHKTVAYVMSVSEPVDCYVTVTARSANEIRVEFKYPESMAPRPGSRIDVALSLEEL